MVTYDNKAIGERLKIARKFARFDTAREAAEALGMPYPTYAAHENGSRGVVRATEKYARRYGVSLDWLLRNKGPGPGEAATPPPLDLVEVPVLSWVSAGELTKEDLADESFGSIKVGSLPPGDWIALKVIGDSMDRISPPDSTILVNRSDRRLVPNACYVIADTNGDATYKRYRPDPMRFEPVSTNKDLEAIFPDQEPLVVGRVRRSMIDM